MRKVKHNKEIEKLDTTTLTEIKNSHSQHKNIVKLHKKPPNQIYVILDFT